MLRLAWAPLCSGVTGFIAASGCLPTDVIPPEGGTHASFGEDDGERKNARVVTEGVRPGGSDTS
jgi:hypothetical protein